jgi:hypothetical protein
VRSVLMLNKITPQEFLDSTVFNYLTKNSCGSNFPYLLHTNLPVFTKGFYWVSTSGGKNLLTDEIESIDWADFDCSKPLERTKWKIINDENGPYGCPFCKMFGIVGLRELQDHLDFKCKFFKKGGQ